MAVRLFSCFPFCMRYIAQQKSPCDSQNHAGHETTGHDTVKLHLSQKCEGIMGFYYSYFFHFTLYKVWVVLDSIFTSEIIKKFTSCSHNCDIVIKENWNIKKTDLILSIRTYRMRMWLDPGKIHMLVIKFTQLQDSL